MAHKVYFTKTFYDRYGTEVLVEYKDVTRTGTFNFGVIKEYTQQVLVVTVGGVSVEVEAAFGGYCDEVWLDVEVKDEDGDRIEAFSTDGYGGE